MSTTDYSTQKENPTILGKQLNDPYTVEQMSLAWDKLSSTKRLPSKESIIKTTHYYVKFIPKNEAELDILKKDSTLILYEYPLDYEILKQGDYYREANLPKDQPTYQYASVPVNKDLPIGVEYEILKNLFIPDEFKIGQKPTINFSIKMIEELVDTSIDMVAPDPIDIIAATRWRPAGRIMVWDDNFGNWSPVRGAIVRARRWYTTHTGEVNENGFYSCDGQFRRRANYSIVWDRYHYSIRSGAVGQAIFNGPKQRGDWNLNIADNSLSQFYAFIHLAAHRYYYLDILGIKRPPLNSTWKPQMKIGAYDKDGRANHNEDRRLLGIRNQTKMYRLQNGNIRDSETMYNVSLHELAHASHWELRKNNWDNGRTEDKLQESWAMGVAWRLTRLRYPRHNAFENLTFRWMRTTGESQYTSLIIDLMEGNNQGVTDTSFPFDRVNGYTLAQIESGLDVCDNIQDLETRLRNDHTNTSEQFLNELFTQYINLSR